MPRWIDISSDGFEVVVSSFTETPDEKAVVLRGDRHLTGEQVETLGALGFIQIPGPRTVWVRPGSTFRLSEIRSLFPSAAVVQRDASQIRIRVSGPSPFAIAAEPPAAAETLQAESQPSAPDGDARENRFQVKYRPMSAVGQPIAMIPTHMQIPTRRALENLVKKVGNLDEWVASRLGWEVSEMAGYLAPEQVDAVGLALDDFDRNRAILVADQTGLGKGRVLAAVMRAVVLGGDTAFFLTETDNLFSDIWRDISDINSQDIMGTPFMMNDGAKIVDLSSLNGDVIFKPQKQKFTKDTIRSGKLPEGCKLVLGTYSQFNRMGTQKVKFLHSVAKDCVIINDESHNIAGDSNINKNITEALDISGRSLNSSATFAKRAENMAAYKTAFPPSLRNIDIVEMLKRGGRPLQEALSQMLAEDGVLIRREQDMSQVKVVIWEDAKRRERNEEVMEQMAPILSSLARLSYEVSKIVDRRNEADGVPQGGATAKGRSRGKWYAVNFGSRLSIIKIQITLALLVDFCAEKVCELLQQGHAPAVAMEATMESLMRELMKDSELDATARDDDVLLFDSERSGEETAENEGKSAPDMRSALNLMVDRIMMISKRVPGGDPERFPVEDPRLLQEAQRIKAMIATAPNLPLSPLDDIRDKVVARSEQLVREGKLERPWRIEEISGRSLKVVNGVYEPVRPVDRNAVISGFQHGNIDALLLTRPASTGLSLHAIPSNPKKRVLIELQPSPDVNTRVQFWGRFKRRGGVNEPLFATLSTGLPFQVRSLAMLNRQLADLSANVTANSENSNAMDTPDLINALGDRIARRLLDERPEAAKIMQIPMNITQDDEDESFYFINKLLSRLPLLSTHQEQEEIYQALLTSYEDELKQMEAQGLNPRKQREMEGTWKVLSREVFEPGNPEDGPVFGRPVYVTEISSKQKVFPLSGQQIMERVQASREKAVARFGGDGSRGLYSEAIRDLKAREQDILQEVLPKSYSTVSEALKASSSNVVKITLERTRKLRALLSEIEPGISLMTRNDDGEAAVGVIAQIVIPDEDERHLPGKWIVRYAFPGDQRLREISMATIINDSDIVLYSRRGDEQLPESFPQFDQARQGEVTVIRKVLDGNLVSAVRAAREGGFGTTVSFVDEQGVRQRAVLIPKSKQRNLNSLPGTTRTVDAAINILKNKGRVFTNPSDPLQGAILRAEAGYGIIEIPGKKRQSKPFETRDILDITGKFEGDWRFRSVRVSLEELRRVMEILIRDGHSFHFDGRYRKFIHGSGAEPEQAAVRAPTASPGATAVTTRPLPREIPGRMLPVRMAIPRV